MLVLAQFDPVDRATYEPFLLRFDSIRLREGHLNVGDDADARQHNITAISQHESAAMASSLLQIVSISGCCAQG
jgi:hypothetical protein